MSSMSTVQDVDVEALAERLDEARGRMAELDPLPRRLLTDHLAAIDELHAAALTTIVRTLRDDARGKELLFELVDDPAVHMVLAMHGIVRPSDPTTLARQALDRIRPGVASHGGDVQLAELDDGVAYVRLSGACNGCSMASVTMREGVEQALREAVPGLRAVEVLPNEPDDGPLIALEVIGPGGEITVVGGSTALPSATEPAPAGAGWYQTFPVQRIAPGTLEACSLTPDEGEAVEVIVVNAAGRMAAYINACAHQGMPLDTALVDGDEGTITCPWHGFCFDASSGECLTAPGAQLEPLPLRIDDGHIWVHAGR